MIQKELINSLITIIAAFYLKAPEYTIRIEEIGGLLKSIFTGDISSAQTDKLLKSVLLKEYLSMKFFFYH